MVNITVVQNSQPLLEVVKRLTSRKSPSKIVYTLNPEEVLVRSLTKKPDIVVTGEEFYPGYHPGIEMSRLTKKERELLVIDAYTPAQEGIKSGTDLAEALYQVDPTILTLRYSTQPGKQGRFVGDIPKEDARTLIHFLSHPDLGDIVQARDWQSMRDTFTDITFYDTLETK
jgi:hypothetical protein